MDREIGSRCASAGVLDLHEPASPRLPVVLSSPHSGCEYPPHFVNASRLDPVALRQSEDSFVDELFAAAPQLGTIARVVANGEEIYSEKLRFADAEQRIERLYYPYHHALRRLVEETERLFGGYLLVDCHSMPSTCASGCGQDGADIVLGDCYGASCAPRIVEAAKRFLMGRGFKVAINAPYAGGFTTEFYGRPKAHRHALQIEVNRALYMDERNYARKPRFVPLGEELADLVRQLSQATQECLPKTTRERHFD